MTKIYEHTQVGYLMLIVLTLGMFCVTFWMISLGFSWIAFAALIVLDLSLILFSTLTVEVTDGILDIKIGPGVFHKQFNLNDVKECFVVSTPQHMKFERWMPEGWLYNLSGMHAIELKMRNGKYYRIGTNTPSELADAIQKAIGGGATKLAL